MDADRDPEHVAAGERVLGAMEAAGYKRQTDLAKDAGVVPLTINRVVKGRGALSKELAEALAPLLKRSAAWLMYGTEDAASARETAPAVGQYLQSEFGADISPRVAHLLQTLDFSSIGVPNPTVRDVHRVREMIEVNLTIAAQRRNE